MRPGLVVVGALLLLLAASLLYGVMSQASGHGHVTTHLLSFELPAGETTSAFGWGTNGSVVSVALSWRASSSVEAVLSAPTGCQASAASCATGTVLAQWGPNLSGAWAAAGSSSFPLLLRFTNAGAATASVTVSLVAAAAPPAPLAPWVLASALLSAATLLAVGGVSLFLGLFLRGGVFRPPAAPPSRGPPGPT